MMTTSTVGDRINGNVIMLYKTLRSLMTFFLDLKGNKETTNCHWRGSIFYFSSYNQTDACALLDFLSSIIILVSNVLLCPEDKETWSCIDPSFFYFIISFSSRPTLQSCAYFPSYILFQVHLGQSCNRMPFFCWCCMFLLFLFFADLCRQWSLA